MLPVKHTDLSNQILVITAGRSAREQMLEWIAQLAIQGGVIVVDGGNRFNVYRVARLIRKKTSRLHDSLRNIKISRSFSCYQMAALLQTLQVGNRPLFILDLLFSFYDEDIKTEESHRLLERSLTALMRLSQNAPVIISTQPLADSADRHFLLEMLTGIASVVWKGEQTDHLQPETPPMLPLLQKK